MRKFEIIDGSRRSAKPCAVLNWSRANDSVSIDIAEWADEADVPMLFMPFVQKSQRHIDDMWARRWVEERVVPSGRQNLGQVLRSNNLQFYDPMELLIAGEGRCAQDDFFIREACDALLEEEVVSRRIGRYVKEMRECGNLSQTELAEKCGMYQSALSRLENGEGNPTVELLECIAEAFGKKLEIRFV